MCARSCHQYFGLFKRKTVGFICKYQINDLDGFDAVNGEFTYQRRSDWLRLFHVTFIVDKRFKAGIH